MFVAFHTLRHRLARSGAPTATFIPVIQTKEERKVWFKDQIARAPAVEKLTITYLMKRVFTKIFYYQNEAQAMKSASNQAANRGSSNIFSLNGSNPRTDVESEFGSRNLPLFEGTDENIEMEEKLRNAIMNYLIDVLGMDPAHSQFVKYYSFLWLNGSGRGGTPTTLADLMEIYFFCV